MYEKTKKNGVEIDTIIDDAAYSGKENVHSILRLNPSVSKGYIKEEDAFEFNKDAGLFVCPEGYIAVRKAKRGKKDQVVTHEFDIEIGKIRPSKKGCYKDGAKSKTYSISIKSDNHLFQKRFQEMARQYYKIEAKNVELKQKYGFDVARASGLFNMELQQPQPYLRLI